jgi:hypothetical protein
VPQAVEEPPEPDADDHAEAERKLEEVGLDPDRRASG